MEDLAHPGRSLTAMKLREMLQTTKESKEGRVSEAYMKDVASLEHVFQSDNFALFFQLRSKETWKEVIIAIGVKPYYAEKTYGSLLNDVKQACIRQGREIVTFEEILQHEKRRKPWLAHKYTDRAIVLLAVNRYNRKNHTRDCALTRPLGSRKPKRSLLDIFLKAL